MNYLYAAPWMDTLGTRTRIQPLLSSVLITGRYDDVPPTLIHPHGFCIFSVQAGAGCAIGAIPWGRGRMDESKMDEEWIRSGKCQSKKQGLEKRRKTPEKNTADQELETSFRSLEGWRAKSDNHRKGECGELPQDVGYKILISRIQREGIRTEGRGWQSSSTPFFQELSN